MHEKARLKFQSKLQEGLDKASFLRSPLLLSGLKPWAIPRDEELTRLSANLVIYDTHDKVSECIRWRFSAAAVAIHFLESASQSVRLGVRKVVLHENKRSVAKSEYHMLGLVPFCSQNPHLQIQRRLNVWGNFSTATADSDASRFASLIAEGPYARHNQKYAIYIGENYCKWITEACALSANGMPAGSFSLVFDGDPALEQSSQMFEYEYVKEDAAWQSAQAQWFIDHKLNPGPVARIAGAFHMSAIFPQAINDIVEGTSFISCNFPTGEAPNPETVLRKNRHIKVFSPGEDGIGVGMPASGWARASGERAGRLMLQT